MNRKTLFIAVAGLLLLVFAVAGVLYQQSAPESGNQSALEREGAPILRDPTTPRLPLWNFLTRLAGPAGTFIPL